MSRRFKSTQRFLKPDPRFQNMVLAKFINCLMRDGKKTTARRVFYDALDLVKQRIPDEEPDQVFLGAVNNIKPQIEVRSKRVGGATYQVPIEVRKSRQQTLAFRWILEITRTRRGRPMATRLADEICAAFNREGATITKRENTHKMADANKMNSHFAW